jgi:PAS domain S-box-containing protein
MHEKNQPRPQPFDEVEALRQRVAELERCIEDTERRSRAHAEELSQANETLRQEVAQRRRAEEGLRKNQALFEMAQERARLGHWELDLSAQGGYWSREMYRLFGFDPASGPPAFAEFLDRIHPDDRALLVRANEQALAGRESVTVEFRTNRASGPVRYFKANLHCERDAAGRPLYLSGTVLDITERELAEQARRESDARLRTALESTPFGFWIMGPDGRYAMQNAVCVRQCGDFVGKRPEEIGLPADVVAAWQENNRRAFAGEVVQNEIEYNQAGAKRFCINIVGPIRQDDRIQGIVGINIDITERKKADEALRESEEKWRTIVETVPDFITIVDRQGIVHFINRVAPRVDIASVIGSSMFDYVAERDHAPLRAAFEELFRSGAAYELELAAGSPGGRQRIFQVHGRPLKRDGTVVGALHIVSDITVRKQNEARLEASLKEKEVLLQEIHHRVKNNLQVISSLLSLQAEHIAEPEAREAFLESRGRVRTMAVLHESLYRSGDLGRLDLGRQVRGLCAELFRSYGVGPNRIELRTDLTEAPLDLDRAIPCGLLLNELVSNALKHAFPGGRGGWVRVALHTGPNEEYTLVVGDNGVGLRPELDVFATSTLGLQLVHTLTRQLGGRLSVDRTGGTTFQITFTVRDSSHR